MANSVTINPLTIRLRPDRIPISGRLPVGGMGLLVRVLPDKAAEVSDTWPVTNWIGVRIVTDPKSSDGWQHLVAKRGINTWFGWVPPRTFPDENNPSPQIAPNSSSASVHSANDTYERTIEIVQENKSRGVRDDVGLWARSFDPVAVCYSFTHGPTDPPGVNRQCDSTGEVLRAPGDLAVQPNFWQTYDDVFRAPGTGPVEVALKGHEDGKTRYISCSTAELLNSRRKTLIQSGAKP